MIVDCRFIVCHSQRVCPSLLLYAGVVAVSAGNEHSLLLKQDGSVWAAGDNFYGQLGAGDTGFDTRIKTFVEVVRATAGACGRVSADICVSGLNSS